MKTISVLGCGWLGLPLAIELKKLGYQVKGSTTTKEKLETLKKEGIESFLIDLNYPTSIPKGFLDSDTLILNIPPRQLNMDALNDFITVLNKSNIKNIIHISSTSVYDTDNQIKTEKSETNQGVVWLVEKVLKKFTKNMTILRFGGLLGPDRNPYRFFMNRKSLTNPEGYINFIHQEDCIQLIIEILQQKKWNKVYNGVASSHPKRIDFYNILLENKGYPTLQPEKGKSHWKIIDNSYIKEDLNYQFIWDDITKAALSLD